MNKVFLIGNLTRDPEMSSVGANNTSICRFSIAVNRRKNGNQETDFYNVSVWGALGENCAKYLKKGRKVAVSGDIELRNYEDKEGNKRISVDVNARDVEFLTSRDSENSSYDQSNNGAAVEMKPITDDSLPF